MLLSKIPDGSKVFIDSNIFIYHLTKFDKFAESSLAFFQRVETGLILGYTSTLVLAEVLHRLMIIEACNKLSLPPKKLLDYLKTNPEKIKLLTDHLGAYSFIEKMGVFFFTVSAREIEQSNSLKREYNLFTNDAINLAVMKNNSITLLASNDPDFEKIDLITLCKP